MSPRAATAAPMARSRTGPSLRELRQRVRQQELLAELGVLALKGTPFPELLDRTARLAAEGLRAEFCQGAGAPAGREPAAGPRRGRLAAGDRRQGQRRRRPRLAGRLRAADRQARDLQPPGERGALPHARAAGRARHPPRDERDPAGRRHRRIGVLEVDSRDGGRVRRARHRLPAGRRQPAGHGDRAAADRGQPALGGGAARDPAAGAGPPGQATACSW